MEPKHRFTAGRTLAAYRDLASMTWTIRFGPNRGKRLCMRKLVGSETLAGWMAAGGITTSEPVIGARAHGWQNGRNTPER